MVQSIQGDLRDSNYVAALQGRLGNNGASVTISNGLLTSEKALLGQRTNLLSAIPRVADVVSLSPTAQRLLSNFSIALALLSAAAKDTKGNVGGVVTGSPSGHSLSPNSSTIVAVAQPSNTVKDGKLLITSDDNDLSNPSASQILDLAKTQESNPNFTFDVISASKDFYTQGLSADAKTSFLSALSDKTLSIESTSSIAGLNYNESVTITGTSESFVSGGVYNSNILREKADNGFITSTAFGGSFYVSWNNKSASTA